MATKGKLTPALRSKNPITIPDDELRKENPTALSKKYGISHGTVFSRQRALKKKDEAERQNLQDQGIRKAAERAAEDHMTPEQKVKVWGKIKKDIFHIVKVEDTTFNISKEAKEVYITPHGMTVKY